MPFIEPIRFGYLGLCTERRGFPLFLKLAQKATALFSQRVEFHSIGRLASDLVYLDMSCLKTAPYLEDLPREDYLNRLLKLHFVVFPFPVRHTAMVSSGTLADTVAFRKPVIARNMPIFQDLCKQWGDIGYLFDEDAQMLQVVEAIIKEADAESYLRQTKNLERLSQSRSPEATASCYYATCQQLSSIT